MIYHSIHSVDYFLFLSLRGKASENKVPRHFPNDQKNQKSIREKVSLSLDVPLKFRVKTFEGPPLVLFYDIHFRATN